MKKHRFVETERQLRGIKNIENDDFVTASAEGSEVLFQSVDRRQQIGDEHHHAALRDNFRDPLQGTAQVGLRAAGRLFEGNHQMAQMPRSMPRRKILANLLVEAKQPNTVPLQIKEIGQSRRSSIGVFGFGVGKRAVGHGPAIVHQQMAAQVGFIFKLLDVITIAARKQPPIQVTRIIARRVLAVFREFHREPVIRTAMNARPESLHYNSGAQLQVLNAHQRPRMNQRSGSVLECGRHHWIADLRMIPVVC